ncbi:hypothetical protein LXL04_033082 [Taraxacum kok-saghyz]
MARYLTRALLPRWRDAFSDFPLYLPRFEIRIERDAFSDFRSLLLISQFAVNSLTLKLILLDSQSPTPEPSRHHPLAIPPPADLNRRLISIWLCHFIRITTGPLRFYTDLNRRLCRFFRSISTGTPILLNLHIFTHLKIEGVEKETTRRIKEKETTRVREKTHRPVHTPGSLSPHLSDPSHSPVSEPPTVLRPSDANSDQEAIEINVTKLLLRSYYDIVRKNIEDYVPKAIMHFLVNHTKLELHNVFIKKLYRYTDSVEPAYIYPFEDRGCREGDDEEDKGEGDDEVEKQGDDGNGNGTQKAFWNNCQALFFSVHRKNIEDYVPKAIMHFLVNHTKLELHNVFIKKLYRAAAGLLFLSMPRAVSVSQVLADFLLSREVVSRAALGCSVLMGSATATL